MQGCNKIFHQSIILFALSISTLSIFAHKATSDPAANDPIIFQPLYRKCIAIKKELNHPNLNVTYGVRPRKHQHPDTWLLHWQKIYIPIPRKKYRTLIVFNYKKSVKKLTASPGFILLAEDGTAVIAMHYFKTLKFVYTNGIDFITNLPKQYRKHIIVKDLYHPEISTSQQSKMFTYKPQDLNCYSLSKTKRAVVTALLLVKLNYSLGKILSVYKTTGGYGGWVSKERTQIHANQTRPHWIIWKGFYTRLFSRSVVNHVRIYSPENHDIHNLDLSLGFKYQSGYKNRPNWLYRLESVLYKRTANSRIQFLQALKQANFDQPSLSNAAGLDP